MMKQRWLVSADRSVRAGAVVCAAAVLLVATMGAGGTGTTAEATRASRLHHVSAGHAQAAVPVKPETAKPGAKAKAKPDTNKAGEAKPGAAKKSDAKPPVTSKAKPRRKKQPETEDVSDPIPMHQAGAARPKHEVPSRLNAAHPAVPAKTVPHPTVMTAKHDVPVKPMTGVSRPAMDTQDDYAEYGPGEQPPAPIVRMAPGTNVGLDDEAASEAGPVVAALREPVVPRAVVTSADRDEAFDGPVVTHQPELAMHNGRVIMPAPLKGSHEVLVHQNLMADDEHLDRIQDDEELERLIAHHLLVGFPEAPGLRMNPELPGERRVARVWTVRFAEDLARNFYERFHQQLTVSSAVRTVTYQLRLQRTNGNAAAVDGDGASPHLTGQAIDIAKHGLTMAEIAWMREYLLPLMQEGRIDVEEEFKQSCFHISVYKSYLPPARRRAMDVAQLKEQQLDK